MTVFRHLFLGAYGGLWRAATPFLRRNKRLRDGFDERLAPDSWPGEWPGPAPDAGAATPPRLWIQAASGGEAWLVHSLVPALVEAFAARAGTASSPPQFLCTTCTRQGLEVLEKLASATEADPDGRAAAPFILPRYFPLDRPDLMEKALAQAEPWAVILLETELWPGLLSAAKTRGLPVFLLNGRITQKSLSGYRYLGSFWQEHAPRRVLAVSQEDAARFAGLFKAPERISVMANIKFDRLAAASDAGQTHDALAVRQAVGLPESSLLAVLASVREEEEGALLDAVTALRGLELEGSPVALAVAPRHMHRIEAWKLKLDRAGIPYLPRSAEGRAELVRDAGHGIPVILWDTFGELQALYGAADAVFVGGSLAPLGGQNFLEPLGQGICPLVGPHVENFHWVGEEIFSSGLAEQVPDAVALAGRLEERLRKRIQALRGHFSEAKGGRQDWRGARAAEAALVRERFSAWLSPRTGGSAAAASAVLAGLFAEVQARQLGAEPQ